MKQSHELDYKIIGNDLQMVEVTLDPGETVIAEAGAMSWMEQDIDFEARLGDGKKRGFMGAIGHAAGRMLGGESLFLTHFTNSGHSRRSLTFAGPWPGTILAADLAALGGELLCQKDAFLCAAMGTAVSIAFRKRLGAGLFGGEGFIMQRMRGDGLVFLHAGGTVVRRELRDERLRVDTGCVVAFSPSLDYDIAMAGGLKSALFGGEGLFLTTLAGRGVVYLQSMPFSRLAGRILQHAPGGGKQRGEGSIISGIFGAR